MSPLERRRKSSLAGTHPAIPETPETPAKPAPATHPPVTPAIPAKTKITLELDTQLIDQAKNAWWAAHQHGLIDKWSHYVTHALAEYTHKIQDDLNNGKPLPPRPQGPLAPGRPVT